MGDVIKFHKKRQKGPKPRQGVSTIIPKGGGKIEKTVKRRGVKPRASEKESDLEETRGVRHVLSKEQDPQQRRPTRR